MNDAAESTRGYARHLRSHMTDAETILWSQLRRQRLSGLRFRRQHVVGPFIIDFACIAIGLAIEVDGATHGTDVELAYDGRREAYLRKRGFTTLRIRNEAIYRGLDDVLDLIWHEAKALHAKRASLKPFPPRA